MPIDPDTGEIITPFFRNGYNYDTDTVSRETGLSTPIAEGRTQQQFKEETDINEIVRRFGLTGTLPDNPHMPNYGDFTGISDFKTAVDMVAQAESAFMEFPAELRARFQNDPQRLMEFLDNEANRKEALELGLVAKPQEKTRDMVQAIDEMSAKLPTANPAESKAKS